MNENGHVRIGTVTDINTTILRARVKFQSEGMTSGWLFVLQRNAGGVFIKPDGEHTHTITDTYTAGGSASTVPDHDHTPGSYTTQWMPKINDTVLCLYLDGFNSDGFILGGIG